jgi:hypothetical protein
LKETIMRRFFLCYALIAAALPLAAAAQTATPPAPPAATTVTQPTTDPDAPAPGAHMGKWRQKFDAANTTHDGHLTLAQAQAAGLTPVVANFTSIDTGNRGYVTFNEVMAWHLDQEAKKLEAQAAALRAQD